MAIIKVMVKPVGVLSRDYRENATCIFAEQGIRAGQTIAVPCILYPKDDSIRKRLTPGLEAIFARTIILQAQVGYKAQDGDDSASITTRIPVVPPLVAVFYGGMVGALMLALFRGLAPFLKVLPTFTRRTPFSWRELLERAYQTTGLALSFVLVTTAWLVLGGICAMMIIILTKASTGDLSPIKVEINDFIGGVLVGLLSFPVVKWLQKRLAFADE
jgi:hypothetical protein